MNAVLARLNELEQKEPEENKKVRRSFEELSQRFATGDGDNKDLFSNAGYVRALAELLGLPVELFDLRVREILAEEEKKAVERALQEMTAHSI